MSTPQTTCLPLCGCEYSRCTIQMLLSSATSITIGVPHRFTMCLRRFHNIVNLDRCLLELGLHITKVPGAEIGPVTDGRIHRLHRLIIVLVAGVDPERDFTILIDVPEPVPLMALECLDEEVLGVLALGELGTYKHDQTTSQGYRRRTLMSFQ